MSYRIVKKKIDGTPMYVIIDDSGEQISEWEDLQEARSELHDLNAYAEDCVDFMARSTPDNNTGEHGNSH
jgi:hypothetical protein